MDRPAAAAAVVVAPVAADEEPVGERVTFDTRDGDKVTIVGDKIRLQQLFTNLIDNAIKYTSKGAIHIALEKDGETIRVQVKDTGIGMSKEEQGKVFKRFYRVDKSRSRETGGVGLGLSIAEWIVQAHHGRIEVQSELNRGSTFTVSLPLSKDYSRSPSL